MTDLGKVAKGAYMKLDKYKIRQGKFVFIVLCFMFLAGIVLMSRITDLAVKTVEKDATVVKTYVLSSSGGRSHWHKSSGGPHMNIEWTDAGGEIQADESIFNKDGLKVGDTFTILVDAKTQSRRIYPTAGNIFCFVLGILFSVGSFMLIKLLYTRER